MVCFKSRPRALSNAWALIWLAALLSSSQPSAAQEDDAGRAKALEARALFEQGVRKTQAEQWPDAVLLLERSRALVERPATVLNLVLAYERLERPLQVVRMVRRLLEITDPVRHQLERQQALSVEAQAFAKLARVALALAPADATVSVDGDAPVFASPGLMLLEAGRHELVVVAAGYTPVQRVLEVGADTRSELSVSLRAAPMPVAAISRVDRAPPSAARRRGALALGLLGGAAWLSSAAVEGLAYSRAHALEQRDIEAAGYLSESDRYTRAKNTVGPLALSGAALAVASVLAQRGGGPRARSRGTKATVGVLSLAALAAGIALMVVAPPALGRSELDAPSRELGMALGAAALPGLTWTIGAMVR